MQTKFGYVISRLKSVPLYRTRKPIGRYAIKIQKKDFYFEQYNRSSIRIDLSCIRTSGANLIQNIKLLNTKTLKTFHDIMDDFYEKYNYDLNMELIENDLLNFDELRLKKILKKHVKLTNSLKGKVVLENWKSFFSKFVKITPFEFKRALEERKKIN